MSITLIVVFVWFILTKSTDIKACNEWCNKQLYDLCIKPINNSIFIQNLTNVKVKYVEK
jgi:uncharacterized membrane protein required for colicin V production